MEEEFNINDGKFRRQRNLPQYKKLTDDEFLEKMLQKEHDAVPSTEFEKRIQIKLKQYEQDYDLSELRFNDKETLRALIQAQISLEDYEQQLYKLRQDTDSIDVVFKLTKIMSDLRADQSLLQSDLKITRKIRKSDQETSVINYIESLKEKAKKFHELKEQYILCPKCSMLLGTMWTLYPDANNKIELICKRELEDGSKCNTVVKVTTKQMLENKGTNKKSALPESML